MPTPKSTHDFKTWNRSLRGRRGEGEGVSRSDSLPLPFRTPATQARSTCRKAGLNESDDKAPDTNKKILDDETQCGVNDIAN